MRLDPDTLSAIAALPEDWHDSGNLGEGVIRRMAALVAEHRPGGPALSAETGCGKSTLLFSHLSGEHLCFTLEGGDSYPQIRPGGLLVVDDIHIPTITHLFRVLQEDAMWRLLAVELYTAFFQRTDAPTFDPFGDGWIHQRYNRDRFPHKEWLVPALGPGWWLK